MPGAAKTPSLSRSTEPLTPVVVPGDAPRRTSGVEDVPDAARPKAASAVADASPKESAPGTKQVRVFGLIGGDQLVLGVLLFVVLGLAGWHWAVMSGWGSRPIEIERLEPMPLNYKIDINNATWVELSQLDGIGETLAERIVADREANGPFQSVDDLRRVDGIGPKTVAKLRKYVIAGPSGERIPK